MQPLIDVHSHFVTPSYVAAAREAGIEHPDGMPSWPSWDEAQHLADMDRWGIGYAVLSISSPGTHFGDDAAARRLSSEVNDVGSDVARRRPDRFGHFASLPLPDVVGSLAEARRALNDLGSVGLTVESNARGRYLGDAEFEPLWAELDERAARVFVHPTSPVHPDLALGRPRPMLEFLFDTTRTVSDLLFAGVLRRYPAIEWIIPHCGAALSLLSDRMELFRSGFGLGGHDLPPIPEQLGRLWYDLAGTPVPHHARALIDALSDERIVYGSDYCWTPTAVVDQQVRSLNESVSPSGRAWRELTSTNARRLFPGR